MQLAWAWRKVRDKEDDHLRDCSLMILSAVLDYQLLHIAPEELPEPSCTEG